MVFLSLLNNVAFLVSLSIINNLIIRRWKKSQLRYKTVTGLLYGTAAIAGMMTSVSLAPGVIFDGRSIILSLAGFFGGPVTAVIALMMSSLYRYLRGGDGMLAGVLLLVFSAILGVIYHYLRKRYPQLDKHPYLLVFGIIVHIVTLLTLAFFLPGQLGFIIAREVTLPVLTLYPIATVLVCVLFLDQELRSRAEQQVFEEREKLNAILNTAPIPIFYKDTTETYEGANQAFADFVGVPRDQIVGSNVHRVVDTEEARTHHLIDQELLKTGGNRTYELQVTPADGKVHDMVFYKSAIKNAEGGIDGLVGLAMDVSELKNANKALQEKTEELEAYFTSSLDLLCIADTDGYFRRLNPQWEESLGYTIDELIGTQFFDYIHPEDFKKTEDRLRNIDFNDEITNFSNRYRTKSGSYRWIEWRSKIIGGLIYASARDITARVQAEEALRESEARFQRLVESAPDAIYVQTNGKFVYLNQTALKLFNIPSADILLEKLVIERSNPDSQNIEEEKKRILEYEKSGVSRQEQVFLTIDHIPVDVEVSAVPISYQGQNSALVYVRDITDRKQMERKLIEREKLAGIGTLAAGIAHEINSPLQVITGISERVQQRIDAHEQYEIKEMSNIFKTINNNAWRIASIVRSLLDYSHTSAEDTEPTSINNLVQKTLLLVEHQLRSWSNIKVTTDLCADIPPVMCDSNQITQVLINLISNARDSMPAGGIITIQTAFDEPKQRVILRVIDTGMGIPDEIRTKIFDPFFTTKPIGEGTGLGLSIIAGIVRAHGGDFELEKTSSQGSIFTISLPLDYQPLSPDADHNSGRY